MRTQLKPIYDSRKSFYGKAEVEDEEDNTKTLYSYYTKVARITPQKKAQILGIFSRTTTRHIKEFLKQNDFKAENLKQMLKDYRVQ